MAEIIGTVDSLLTDKPIILNLDKKLSKDNGIKVILGNANDISIDKVAITMIRRVGNQTLLYIDWDKKPPNKNGTVERTT